ncbi:PepSY domain-containing protein [Psychrosphaera sp. B3R10]|uniref:PepSY domain-containing protein n=1 Tax=unclassified Psychrosphaera TaxID=2641570 RepID=UPI001C0A5407|nr:MULTISPECIES: PepSY domain-containing protein [unclassified Psychrosphaera]MBU2883086.1 PepSY domain-containing protein [Psychrosphaera sp. I2R16]MBU2988543.1 PepSY domain-containing protein [Psychrosphaera sp. B3R10]
MKLISMRILHRYLGFFLAGIMTIYALSGIVLIYRDTHVFKISSAVEQSLATNLDQSGLGQTLKIKRFKADSEDEQFIYFQDGSYNKTTGDVSYTRYQLPVVLDKLTHLHKATTNSPVYWLNIFFGASLLFFSVSSFWMFIPKSKTFKTGVKYSIAGAVLAAILVAIS